ncbi:MAG: class I SAM-dependent methyltransferase [Bacteroidales bacterium]|nr:class I SAM-dependent methyltransferase [Bacteroidales bacterium]
MNEFDIKAAEWDKSLMHRERAEAVAAGIIKQIPLTTKMTAMEFGAGTGLLSFLLKDHLKEIILIDNSPGMVKVLNEKVAASGADDLRIMHIDLEHDGYTERRFDLIYTLMVLHHVDDIEGIIKKFYDLLNPGGYLAIADLFSEDGSFHGSGFHGHKGFDPEVLSGVIEKAGFGRVNHGKVYVVSKNISDDTIKQFDVFLMTSQRL